MVIGGPGVIPHTTPAENQTINSAEVQPTCAATATNFATQKQVELSKLYCPNTAPYDWWSGSVLHSYHHTPRDQQYPAVDLEGTQSN